MKTKVKYEGGFGTGMGKYGDTNYPEFFPNELVIITLPLYSKKLGNKNIVIGEGKIIDAIVYDGKKPYVVQLTKYGIDGYCKYLHKYNGLELESNSRLLVSRNNIKKIC